MVTKLKKIYGDKTQKIKLWPNRKNHIVTKLKNSNHGKTEIVTKLKLWQNSNYDKTKKKTKCNKTQIVKNFKNSNCDKTQQLKFWQNSKTQIWQLELWQILIYEEKKRLKGSFSKICLKINFFGWTILSSLSNKCDHITSHWQS